MSDINLKEVKAIARLLAKTAELAEQASLTGSYEDGTEQCVQQYNISVTRLEQLEAVPQGFFPPLVSGAGYGAIGVACAQLASYIDEESGNDNKTTYHGPKFNILNQNAPSLSREEMEELKALRELLNRHRS